MIPKKETSGLPGGVNDRSSVSSTVDAPDEIDDVLQRFPTDVAFIVREMERLRTENAQKKMELDQMCSTFKTVFALQKRDNINLQAEVRQLRGRIEEMTNGEHENGQGNRRRGEVNAAINDEERGTYSREQIYRCAQSKQELAPAIVARLTRTTLKEISTLSNVEENNENRLDRPKIVASRLNVPTQNLQNVNHGIGSGGGDANHEHLFRVGEGRGRGFGWFGGGQENRPGFGQKSAPGFEDVVKFEREMRTRLNSRLGLRVQDLLCGREKSISIFHIDKEASVESRQTLSRLAQDLDFSNANKLRRWMNMPYFTCMCGEEVRNGYTVLTHFNTEKHFHEAAN